MDPCILPRDQDGNSPDVGRGSCILGRVDSTWLVGVFVQLVIILLIINTSWVVYFFFDVMMIDEVITR